MVFQSDVSLTPKRPSNVLVNGMLQNLNPADFLSLFARVAASLTITVTGTITDADEVTVDINLGLLPGGKVSKTIVVAAADTTTTLAQKIAKELADDATLRSYGAYAYALSNVVTVKWPGALGNQVSCSVGLSVGATEVLTLSNSGDFSGGSGPIVPFKTFNIRHSMQTLQFEAGKPVNVGDDLLALLVQSGSPIF